MGELIIANQRFDIDAPVVNWYQSGWDATAERCILEHKRCVDGRPYGEKAKNRAARRYGYRPALRRYGPNPPLDAVKAVVTQFVLHHDGMYSAEGCFHVLHDERGLSCHFLVDNDGTIYQTLDLAYCGFHAAEFNPRSIGVELCNRGDAKKEPHYYDDKKRYPDRRDQKAIKVHGSKILAYDYTKPQYQAMSALAKALTKLLPGLPVEYPQSAPGQQAWGLIANPGAFNGYVGHYHLTTRKWDPGPFDFKDFCERLRGTLSFPMWTGKKPSEINPRDRPEIPEDVDELRKRTDALIDANEQRAEGGFFPVGPWGNARLWHGGIHLPAPEGDGPPVPVYAAFPGRIVAARMGKTSPIGSVNFVLMRHSMSVGPSPVKFYSLHMHLHDELAEKTPLPPWMLKDNWKKLGKKGVTVLLDEPVEAGEVIGRIGKVGPVVDGDDLMKAQMHYEIFAEEALFTEFDGEKWQPVDGLGGGRFCDQPAINDVIDDDKDGKLSRRELVSFYSGSGDRQGLRWLVTYHVSEWTESPSWNDALRVQADYRDVKPEDIDTMIDEQINPAMWWTDEVAKHAGLPGDGIVYHYHPLTFIQWVNNKILEAAADPSLANQAVDANETSEVTGMTADANEGSEEHDGEMVSDADLTGGQDDLAVELENLVEGFAGEPEEP